MLEKVRSPRVPYSSNPVRRPQKGSRGQGFLWERAWLDGGGGLAGFCGLPVRRGLCRGHPREAAPGARGRLRGDRGSATGGFGELALRWQGPSPHEAASCHFHQSLKQGISRSAVWGEGEDCHLLFFLSFFPPPRKRAALLQVFWVPSSAAPPWLGLQTDVRYIIRKSFF